MGQFHDVLIVGIVFFSIVGIIKVLSDNRLRQKLIEKGQLDENVKYLYSSSRHQTLSSLKWGFVLIGLGLALLIGQLAPPDVKDEMIIGGMFILAGLGLLLFYHLSNQLVNKSDKK